MSILVVVLDIQITLVSSDCCISYAASPASTTLATVFACLILKHSRCFMPNAIMKRTLAILALAKLLFRRK